MKIYKIIMAAAMPLLALSMQSCLDFDEPADEFQATDVKLDDEVFHGKADEINYIFQPTEEGMDKAIDNLDNYFRQTLTGQYAMRGGKDGDTPGPHAYQRQFSLGPDNYTISASTSIRDPTAVT